MFNWNFYTHYTRGFTKSGKVAEQHLYIVIYKIALLPPSDPIRKWMNDFLRNYIKNHNI